VSSAVATLSSQSSVVGVISITVDIKSFHISGSNVQSTSPLLEKITVILIKFRKINGYDKHFYGVLSQPRSVFMQKYRFFYSKFIIINTN
jgi:hypothetical protein